ncbi:dynamin family protein [Shimazuella sp. AN120528]|uniref:dynamin family protein n=1 Tax=Shimazuella soli TaxID=1892854 RepID=UPI001F0F1F45|nr:dynamin family protein [Shimazuella soli]MCH5583536.1 dynamin family protein [Shimazuella soli]
MLQTPTSLWINRLALLMQTIPTENNQEFQHKCIDFMQKLNHGELAVAFCGHFSAGKSSLMNHLFGMSLLPTSPIPTSANVVKVKHGPNKIQMRYFNGTTQEVIGTYTDEAFQALCQDGQRATEVVIERMDVPLPPHVAIVDTPGVDSTDEAHRLATEANLHVSDVIFYMMDYNHVQAEGNLQFVKDLTDRGKQVYLIINQIDKHRDKELSFADFQKGVAASFAAWNIHVAGIYFTSLKQPDHPHNQLTQVKSLLHQLYEQKNELMEKNVEREISYLIAQYVHKKAAQLPALETLQRKREEYSEKEQSTLQQLAQWEHEKQQIFNQLMKDLDHLLKNAYLMPANLRELANSYLEAMQPNFKMGLLFAKSKTEQERNHREQQFLQSLTETVSTELTGHITDLISQHARKYMIFQPSLADELHQTVPRITIDLLRSTIKQGAGFSGNYVLTYTTDLAEQIKSLYRAYVRQYLTNHLPELETGLQQQIQQGQMDLQVTQKDLEQIQQDIQAHANIDTEQQALLAIIKDGQKQVPTERIEKWLKQDQIVQSITLVTEEKTTSPSEEMMQMTSTSENNTEQKQNLLLQAEKTLESLPELQPFFERLRAKRIQMEQQQFTVALFGAFSAGKSSFANALLGDALLPVSPNPTTATVCRICPPTLEHGHGTGTVTFKSGETLFQELQHLFELFHQKSSASDVTGLVEEIPELLSRKLETTRQKMAIPFLRAIQNGFADVEQELGQTIAMSQTDAISYMADEAKSAFVEEVALYYDSILAKLGITLVDTPGADSLHARHTDVAFRYMKQADALLFVTYYNHAFSRADRELLIQLGRVQDSFALDKMYFIVNAADLAASQTELEKVVDYVASQLHQYGIRHPRMFPVSSLASLSDKQENRELNPDFARFEQAFLSFIQEDSRAATIGRMISDVEQANIWIEEMLTAISASESEKAAQQQQWEQAKNSLVQQFSSLISTTEERNLAQEIKTLLYYVGERLRLRYYDEFAFYINPSTIRESGKAGRKQLTTAAKELLAFIGNDLIQEYRATSLRLEKWIQTALEAFTKEQNNYHHTLLSGLALSEPEDITLPELTWTQPVWEEAHPNFQKAVQLYKNGQSFFEQNGRDKMKELLKLQVEEILNSHIAKTTEEFVATYTAIWQQNIEQISKRWIEQVTDHFVRLEASMQGQMEEKPLIEAKTKLSRVLTSLEDK